MARMPLPEPPHYDAHQSNEFDMHVTQNTNNYLVRLDPLRGEAAEPDLATSWAFTDGGKTLTFKLAPGVKFHDGTPLTCADIQFSYQRIYNPPAGMVSPRKSSLAFVDSIQCPDPLTAVFKLKEASADALPDLGAPFNIVYPKHIAGPNDAAGKFMRNDIIGSGPFKLKSRRPGDMVELQKNPDYFKPGLPYLDGMQFIFMAREYRTWTAAFQTGRVDFIPTMDSPALSDEMRGRNDPRWIIEDSPKYTFISFIPQMSGFWLDAEVRKAAAMALIQDELVATLCPIVFGCFNEGMLPSTSEFALPRKELEAFPGYGKDAAARRTQARQILQQKGLVGQKLELYSRGDHPAFRDPTIAACDMLSKVGFGCTTKLLDQGPYYDFVNNRRIPTGQAVVHSIGLATGTINGVLGEAFHPDGSRNYGIYTDDVLKDLYAKQSQEMDPVKRKQMVLDYQRRFLSQNWHVVMAWRGGSRFWWNYLRGPVIHNHPLGAFWSVQFEQVWLDK